MVLSHVIGRNRNRAIADRLQQKWTTLAVAATFGFTLTASAQAGGGVSPGVTQAGPPISDLSNRYVMNAQFDPRTGQLQVDGSMTIVADKPTDSFVLLLNKALSVSQLECGEGCTASLESDVTLNGQAFPRTQQLRLTLAKPLQKGERLQATFRYAGTLRTNDIEAGRGVVSPGWSEMSWDVLWYPVSLEEPMVTSEVLLTLPPQYDVAAPGQADQIAPGKWRLNPGVPVLTRVTFFTSDRWVVREQSLGGALKGRLYSVVEEPRATEILSGVGGAYNFYRALLGSPKIDRTMLKVAYANRDPGLKFPRQAYATGGDFIVLDESEPQVQMDTLHHEVGHLWFSAGQTGTPDEFLSESLTEYLAMRRGGQVWGPEWLTARRARAARLSGGIKGSLLNIDGFTATRQTLLYQRGPTALWALHDRLGVESMDRFLAEVHAADLTTIAQFFNILEAQHGPDTAMWFRGLL